MPQHSIDPNRQVTPVIGTPSDTLDWSLAAQSGRRYTVEQMAHNFSAGVNSLAHRFGKGA